MASVFDGGAFDPAAFQIDQAVDIPVVDMGIAAVPLRVSVPSGPLLNSTDRYLVTGQRIELGARRFVYVCEQIIFESEVVLALIIDERWEPQTIDPFLLVKDERWELGVGDPNITVIDERWEVTVGNPTTLVKDERWEG